MPCSSFVCSKSRYWELFEQCYWTYWFRLMYKTIGSILYWHFLTENVDFVIFFARNANIIGMCVSVLYLYENVTHIIHVNHLIIYQDASQTYSNICAVCYSIQPSFFWLMLLYVNAMEPQSVWNTENHWSNSWIFSICINSIYFVWKHIIPTRLLLVCSNPKLVG